MTTTTDQGLRGLALLDAVIEHITAHPETWDQGKYRCETGMCVAGHAADMCGGQWVTYAADQMASAYLVAEPDDPADEVQPDERSESGIVSARSRAGRLLGIDAWSEQGMLFAAWNTLADIKRIRDELAAGGLS